jgi:Aspartyl/Asparaginyl beta-hydroxylase
VFRRDNRRAEQPSAARAGLDVSAGDGLRDTGDDPTVDALVAFLRSGGAAGLRHGGGRSLLDHLLGTYAIMRRWGQPGWLQHAALIHSVYGTDSYDRQLLSHGRRKDLAAIAGDHAERLGYLFCVTPRRPLFAGTHLWARDLPTRSTDSGSSTNAGNAPTRGELDALVLLHMANLAEQAQAADGSPGRWLVRLRNLAELLVDSDTVVPPLFIAQLAAFGEADESLTRRAFAEAFSDEGEARTSGLALAAAACPVVAEPCVWLAHISRRHRDYGSSASWAARARNRLSGLGTSWDKRLTFEEWMALIEGLERPPDEDSPRLAEAITHPRALFAEIVHHGATARSTASSSMIVQRAGAPPDAAAGRKRFQRYIETLVDTDGRSSGAIYPDLPSRPWHNPREFPLVGYLESNYPAIRDEILWLAATRFHRESERISRTGDWDVAFLYERGRRHDAVCAACPVTAHGVEAYPAVRTIAGLIYISRMRAGTHISAHRGPTNLRVRCHLAIKVPRGDCAIRVGEHTQRWQEGRCLVFDDHFVHEAWNHTEEDRIVLIVDLWHPGLSTTEVALLEALHDYTYFHAQRLSRYWSANAAAARRAGQERRT